MREEILEEIEKIRQKYCGSAHEIVGDYNRETTFSKDYEGRQIYELLQNADDAAIDSCGKVLIKFDRHTLTISNTGTPFSLSGVQSLLYPNASPKSIYANTIGCKGLGFRAILTWADRITVASMDFTIRFSRQSAEAFYKSIINENKELLPKIQKLSKDPCPIATLSCPEILAEKLFVPGFSTSVIIECKDELVETIETKIKHLEFEELIFLPNLIEIEIDCPDYHKTFYKFHEKNEAIIEAKDYLTGDIVFASWELYKKTGTIPNENKEHQKYEFIIAYDPDGKRVGKVLYSYFKTDVALSFPALIHGTFELNSSRNALQKESPVNKQLVEIFADFLVQTAVDISEKQKQCNYDPLRMVISTGMDHVLSNEYHLDSLLKEKAREKRVLPTISGNYVSVADCPKYSKYRFDKVLSPATFGELMPATDEKEIENYIRYYLNIEFYSYAAFCKQLNDTIKDYNLKQKASLIKLIDANYIETSTDYFPHLLEDCEGRIIDDPVKVFPSPHEEVAIALPEWVKIKFLSEEMEKTLCDVLGIGNNRRELAKKLSRYHMEEYRFERLLRGVTNQVDHIINSAEKSKEILGWLWKYYVIEKNQPINGIKVKILCKDGNLHYTNECYLGKEFDNKLGERIIDIFSSNFVDPSCFDSGNAPTNLVIGFLEWIGVSKFPRFEYKSLTGIDRAAYINSYKKLYVQSERYGYTCSELNLERVVVGYYEHFAEVINEVNINDVLSWFVLDDNIKSRLSSETEEKNPESIISGIPQGKRAKREVVPADMKSYLRWILANKKWIPSEEGVLQNPNHCCFANDNLSPEVIVPKIDYTYIRNVVGRNCKKEVETILSWLGVSDSFQDMDKRVIYDVLFKLQTIDKDCKIGKKLYRKIIKECSPPDEYIHDNPSYTRFIEEGTVLVKNENTRKYVPISEAFYASKNIFCKSILRGMNIFEAERRLGEDNIKKLFGVKPLKYTAAEIDGTPQIHYLNEAFQYEYNQFVPFVYACRMDQKNPQKDFRALSSTKIMLCSQVCIKYSFDKGYKPSELGKFELVILKNKNTDFSTGYIQVPNNIHTIHELKRNHDFANALAELITVILDVFEDKDYYRELFKDDMALREKKMREDRGDDNLENLTESRKMFHSEVNFEDVFWRSIAAATQVDISDESDTPAIIRALGLEISETSKLQYDNLSNPETVPLVLSIFDQLGIDISDFNNMSGFSIDLTGYNKKLFCAKKAQYRGKYEAFLYDNLKNDSDNVDEFCEKSEEYDIAEANYSSTCVDDINALFVRLFKIDFSLLDEYSEAVIESIIDDNLRECDERDIDILKKYCSQPQIRAYALFDKIPSLLLSLNSEENKEEGKGNSLERTDEYTDASNNENADDINDLVQEIFASVSVGFASVSTQAYAPTEQAKPSSTLSHKKRKHTESIEKTKQKIGILGEAIVFRELKQLYPSTRWVSGNAEKVNSKVKGDDTCGYDIVYTDDNGVVQYVEVKASRDDNIVFYLSESEFQFARNHADVYEIIYVHIGEDSKLKGKPERLGHLFVLSDGETLFENKRFTLESNSYTITAKGLPINE